RRPSSRGQALAPPAAGFAREPVLAAIGAKAHSPFRPARGAVMETLAKRGRSASVFKITAIDRYIFRLTLVPMIAVFVIAASLLLLDKMLKLFDFVATEGGPIGVVFQMLANLLPEYASLAIPLGVMLGILLAFRKLAISSELDVLRAVGLSYA